MYYGEFENRELLTCPFLITLDAVVSSTYFQIEALLPARSLIMINHALFLICLFFLEFFFLSLYGLQENR